MALAMLVGGPEAGQPDVGPTAASRLASLGITRVSLLADPAGIGVIVEGWAFDPVQVDEAVRAVFPDKSDAVRVFREIEHLALAAAAAERRS